MEPYQANNMVGITTNSGYFFICLKKNLKNS